MAVLTHKIYAGKRCPHPYPEGVITYKQVSDYENITNSFERIANIKGMNSPLELQYCEEDKFLRIVGPRSGSGSEEANRRRTVNLGDFLPEIGDIYPDLRFLGHRGLVNFDELEDNSFSKFDKLIGININPIGDPKDIGHDLTHLKYIEDAPRYFYTDKNGNLIPENLIYFSGHSPSPNFYSKSLEFLSLSSLSTDGIKFDIPNVQIARFQRGFPSNTNQININEETFQPMKKLESLALQDPSTVDFCFLNPVDNLKYLNFSFFVGIEDRVSPTGNKYAEYVYYDKLAKLKLFQIPKLKVLEIGNTIIPDVGLADYFPNLEYLKFDNCKAILNEKLFEGLCEIHTIMLDGEFKFDDFPNWREYKQLKVLTIDGNQMDPGYRIDCTIGLVPNDVHNCIPYRNLTTVIEDIKLTQLIAVNMFTKLDPRSGGIIPLLANGIRKVSIGETVQEINMYLDRGNIGSPPRYNYQLSSSQFEINEFENFIYFNNNFRNKVKQEHQEILQQYVVYIYKLFVGCGNLLFACFYIILLFISTDDELEQLSKIEHPMVNDIITWRINVSRHIKGMDIPNYFYDDKISR